MTTYFYTQSLATAAAAIEQGFEKIETDKGNGKYKVIRYWSEDGKAWRFPKTPHNVALMEVQEGDLLQIIGGHYHGSVATGNVPEHMKEKWTGKPAIQPRDFVGTTIIYRNNKPFPVWDEEGVCDH